MPILQKNQISNATLSSSQQNARLYLASILFILLSLALTACGPTKTFRAVESPTALILANPDKPIDILKQPLKKEMLSWSNRKISALNVEGILQVEFKDKLYNFLQLSCPSQLTCTGSKAYVPISMTTAYSDSIDPAIRNVLFYTGAEKQNTAFILVPTKSDKTSKTAESVIADYTALRDWLRKPAKPVPGFFIKGMLQHHLASLDEAKREKKLAEWFYLGESYAQKMRNPNFLPYISKYGNFKKIKQVLKGKTFAQAGLTEKQDAFLKELATFAKPEFETIIKRYYDEFPAMAASKGTLKTNLKIYARNYNKKLKLPLTKEYFFKHLLEATEYTVEASINQTYFDDTIRSYLKEHKIDETKSRDFANSNFTVPVEQDGEDIEKTIRVEPPVFQNLKVIFDYEFGAILKWQDRHNNWQESIIETVVAESSGLEGIGFSVKTESTELKILPKKLATYFEDLDRDRFARIAKGIGSLDEILAITGERKRALALALKYGYKKIDYDPEKRMSVITLDQDYYWKMLALLKSYQGVLESDVYSGQANLVNGENGSVRWFQTYEKSTKESSLQLAGSIQLCGRECYDAKFEDVVCLDKSYSTLTVSFKNDAWNKEEELSSDDVKIHIKGGLSEKASYCPDAWPLIKFDEYEGIYQI